MNKIVAKLSSIIDGLDSQSIDIHAYFNMKTGEVVFITDDEIRLAEEGEDFFDELSEWEKENNEFIIEILYGEDYISLPSSFEVHEYGIMEEFCLSIQDDELSDKMYYSIKGKGAFRKFKNNIRKYRLEDSWYKFKEKSLREIAECWCEENNIELIDDLK